MKPSEAARLQLSRDQLNYNAAREGFRQAKPGDPWEVYDPYTDAYLKRHGKTGAANPTGISIDNPYVKGSLAFLRPVTTGLILVPVIQVITFTLINPPESLSVLTTLEGWKSLFNPIPIAAYAVFVFLLFKVKLHPIGVIILGAIFGIIFL